MSIRLTRQDLVETTNDALKQFFEGIKSKQTRITYEGNLRYFLMEVCGDLLHGNFSQRASEFVSLAKNEQHVAIQIVRAYVSKLRERALKPKEASDYLNPSTLPNKIKPIKKLLEMNDVGLAWARIYSLYPELDNSLASRGYNREEIQRMLNHTQEISTKVIILTMSSGGFRTITTDTIKAENCWGEKLQGNNYQPGKARIFCQKNNYYFTASTFQSPTFNTLWQDSESSALEFVKILSDKISSDNVEIKVTKNTKSTIPEWIKTVFKFYSEGQITDNELVQALEFLIKENIIKINSN